MFANFWQPKWWFSKGIHPRCYDLFCPDIWQLATKNEADRQGHLKTTNFQPLHSSIAAGWDILRHTFLNSKIIQNIANMLSSDWWIVWHSPSFNFDFMFHLRLKHMFLHMFSFVQFERCVPHFFRDENKHSEHGNLRFTSILQISMNDQIYKSFRILPAKAFWIYAWGFCLGTLPTVF